MVPNLPAKIAISASVSPSEDPEKVVIAVMNVAGGGPGRMNTDYEKVEFVSDDLASLVHLRDQLGDRRIRAAARRLMEYSRHGTRTEIMINRQAAFAGVIVVCGSQDESPLGPIYLRIQSNKMDDLVGWLTAYE